MISISDNVINEIIIKKSKFITYLFRLSSIDEVDTFLEVVKSEKKDASHYCYAYIFNNTKRFFDDGEPSKTAGMPMLNVLENNNLNKVLAITVRYFGGTKLGAGGLVRAYTSSITEALKKTKIVEFVECYTFDFVFNHEQKNKIENLIKSCIIKNKLFNNNIKYSVVCQKKDYEFLVTNFSNLNIKINNIQKIFIEKAKYEVNLK